MSCDLTFHEYQQKARETAIYPREASLLYPVLGLAGEVGELCEKLRVLVDKADLKLGGLNNLAATTSTIFGQMADVGKRAEQLKKRIRDGQNRELIAEAEELTGAIAGGIVEEADIEQIQAIVKETGDIMWYLANTTFDFGTKLGDVAQANLDKLASRKARGVLQGSGDNR